MAIRYAYRWLCERDENKYIYNVIYKNINICIFIYIQYIVCTSTINKR